MREIKTKSDFISGREVLKTNLSPWVQSITNLYGLVFTIEGTGSISADGQSVKAKSNRLFVLAPGCSHKFTPQYGWTYLWFHVILPDRLISLTPFPEVITGVSMVDYTLPESERVLSELSEAQQLDVYRPPGWYNLASALVETVFIRTINHYSLKRCQMDSSLEHACKLLLETSMSLSEIADRCGMSRAVFFAKFKAGIGSSPRQYREMAQLRRAAVLLENFNYSITEIAEHCGMNDAYYFSTRFRKFFGESPRAYRNKSLQSGKNLNKTIEAKKTVG